MLLDVLSHCNYSSYNILLANMIGLHEAIYVNLLIDINEKAKRKDALSNDYFILDRDYVRERTTFDIEEQLNIEKKLESFNLLSVDEKNSNAIHFNIQRLAAMFTTDLNCLDNVTTSHSKRGKRTKRESVRDNLKSSIVCENNELREAYEGWIDGVYANPKGFLSKRAVTIAQQVVDTFSDHDLDLALTVINIAAVNGYRDMEWAINKYKAEYRSTYKLRSTVNTLPRELSNEVF